MSLGPVTLRCGRCATAIRNNRSSCPCCGGDNFFDVNADSGAPPTTNDAGSPNSTPEPENAPEQEAPAEPKPTKKICPMCMASVPEADMVDLEGQMLCPTCHENMSRKSAEKNKETEEGSDSE